MGNSLVRVLYVEVEVVGVVEVDTGDLDPLRSPNFEARAMVPLLPSLVEPLANREL